MDKSKNGIFYLGTSNITLPGNRQSFPEYFQNKSRLHYYSSLFNSLEVNACFYKLPKPATIEKWVTDTPPGFCFTLKLWKEITHAKQLVFAAENIRFFMNMAVAAGIKKGCLLVQFPGKIDLDYFGQVENILEIIQQENAANEWKIAVEFRHASWYAGETYELLHQYHATLVLHDMPASKNLALTGHFPFLYYRFHGPAGDYRGSYSNDFLEQQAAIISSGLKAGKDVYAYFNNTAGNAFENALQLRKLVEANAGL